MKRAIRAFLALVLAMCCLTVRPKAEPDYTDTGYWSKKCANYQSLSEADVTACKAYVQYQISQNNTKLKEIEGKRSEISSNIQKYAAQVAEYQAQADEKQTEINAIETKIQSKQAEIDATQEKIDTKELEIEEKQTEIDAKVKEIDERQADVDAIREKLRERMVSTQPFMRVNRYLDILMGAESFSQLLRMTEGMIAISEYDNHIMDELHKLIDLLNEAKAQLETAKAEMEKAKEELEGIRQELVAQQDEMEVQKGELVAQQGELLNLKYEAQVIEEEYRKQKAELEAQGNRYASNISGLNDLMKEIAKAGGMDAITSSNGWVFPVPGSVRSAGTWYYGGGGVHLGYDFAAPVGTSIYAVGNGIVINRADGCPYGYLGSTCGSQYGGSSGGGNQVYLLTTVNGSLYAVKYLHMLAGTPIRNGTIVAAGDLVGKVGSSGNSTGPHCHIEVFYLGNASNFSNYAQTWNGDLAFGCGWGYAALSRRCESGVGAPCRIRPESVFN